MEGIHDDNSGEGGGDDADEKGKEPQKAFLLLAVLRGHLFEGGDQLVLFSDALVFSLRSSA